jgi:hypothetical protein
LLDYYGEKLEEEPKKVINEVINISSKKGFWNLQVEFPKNGMVAYKIAQNYIVLVKTEIESFYRKLIRVLLETNKNK